ncbi:MAG: 23S rRNA (pseudouridine(1915)-N(3))-methyltransferase RlmH [Prolixibacteraceae bacterium]|jgi:23S rRNA (pseudouridine1915-N3)-methyltransferase|nr:23S rRNA (pseudouridine(1915)-N(3))-methyltransferase RlmH [Prolixibacteraceae bacterium]NLS99662.1 23S rRNA (pseudouridine(1915)-N(3))-methyltransferase RlmH [Bacteroidales bacterium]OQB81717.1 MAG: Ribosomal RNA large subunit methyltransferase H [Bacteroidetes bacterium ADurb.Bin123]HNU77056.1 23S rRNA (pseudouridine(1915)-N(3))-methyltransferase RlmH [Prolixibacteraceae bacterium]HNZ67725.1 23S rRNA (pseudouridine(1915)-N(3))-methyltransferase RlmH [Prolixibacteraceae bacterium]
MKIRLIVTGKTDAPWLQEGMNVYLKRLKHYINFDIKIAGDLKNSAALAPALQKEKEGDAILPLIEGKKEVYLLDERGDEYTSEGLAGMLEHKMITGCRELLFVIGGPYGFPEKLVKKATGKISLSKLTFSHQMVRLLFVEQLYRALTIIRGEPYHHQ